MAKKKKVDWEPGTYYGSNKYNKAAGLYSGESTKASWVDDEGNKRSWKEGPFRNRAVETWNGDKRVYKSTKNPKPYDVTHIKKKTTQSGGWGFGIDGKEKIVEGKMKRKYDDEGNITKEKFRASNKEDRKMFRKIKKNKRKGITK